MSDQIILQGFPMPPSLNASYKTSIRRAGGQSWSSMRASDELMTFKRDVMIYRQRWQSILESARSNVRSWLDAGFDIRVDIFFCWPSDQVLTKSVKAKNKYKRLDADNRIKAARDGLAHCLEIDDTIIISGLVEKVILSEGNQPCVIVVIAKTKIRTHREILEQLNQLPLAL